MDISIVAAHDRQGAIGVDGLLPWHLPDDLRRFKRMTLDKAVLMGRKTAESLGRALPKRLNLVLTRSGRVPFELMEPVRTMQEAIRLAGSREMAVIGGGDVFALALPYANRMHLTLVDTAVPRADAWFPGFDAEQWREVARERHEADATHAFAFDFVDYERVVPP